MIVENTIVGNTNGIVLASGTEGNVVRRNVMAGNPPVQISVTFPPADGVDIRNSAAPDANIIEDNICLTAVNAACPAVGVIDGEKGKEQDKPSARDQ